MERLQNPSEKGLGEDGKKIFGRWLDELSVYRIQADQSDSSSFFLFYCQFSSIANSSRLPISAMGDICRASAPRGELLCAAVFN